MKQGAVAALFLTDGARKECRALNIDFSDLHSVEKIAELTRAVRAGLEKEKTFAGAVKTKVIETVKWSGIYYDEDLAAKGIEPSKITATHAKEIMQMCSRAFMLISDEKNINIARYAFPVIYPDKQDK